MTRLRFVVTLNPSKSEAGDLSRYGDVTFAPMEALADGLGGLDTSLERPAQELGNSSYSYFAEGDLLIAKVTPCFENGKKALVTSLPNKIGFATSEVHVVRANPQRVDANYLRYLLSSLTFKGAGIASMTGAGGLRRISDDAIKDYLLPVRDIHAQRRIAASLDRETARIDHLVRRKRAFREALARRLDAAVDHAVIGSDLPQMKPEVDRTGFLKSVPTGWSIRPLKSLVDPYRPVMYGIVLPGPHVNEGVPIVKGGDVKPHRLRLAKLSRTSSEIEAGYARSRLRTGDLVISIRGGIGDVEIVPAEIAGANLTQDAARVAPGRGVYGEWLRFALRSPTVFAHLAAGANGAAVRGINIFDLDRTPIPTPPPAAQVEIARRLSALEKRTSKLQELVARNLNVLAEHRSALITAAVDGQVEIQGGEVDAPAKLTHKEECLDDA